MKRLVVILLPILGAAWLAACGKPCRPGFEQCQLNAYTTSNYTGYTPRTGPSGSYCPPYCQNVAPGQPVPQACTSNCGGGTAGGYQFPMSGK